MNADSVTPDDDSPDPKPYVDPYFVKFIAARIKGMESDMNELDRIYAFTLGQKAYEAYGKALLKIPENSTVLVDYNLLSEDMRDAWEEAASAVGIFSQLPACRVCGRPTGGCCTVMLPDPHEVVEWQS